MLVGTQGYRKPTAWLVGVFRQIPLFWTVTWLALV